MPDTPDHLPPAAPPADREHAPSPSTLDAHQAEHPPAADTTFASPLDSPEVRYQLLRSYLNPEFDNFQVCEVHGITPTQFLAWLNDPETQQRLKDQTELSNMRAKHCAQMAQPKAVATLEYIIDSYNDAERNELVDNGSNPRARLRSIRQHHRESARRASGLLLRIAGSVPAHLRPHLKSSEPVERESEPREVIRLGSSGLPSNPESPAPLSASAPPPSHERTVSAANPHAECAAMEDEPPAPVARPAQQMSMDASPSDDSSPSPGDLDLGSKQMQMLIQSAADFIVHTSRARPALARDTS